MKFDTVPTAGSRTDNLPIGSRIDGHGRRDESNRIDVLKLIG